ncbi:MAG TPA: hypothetical protein VNF51_00165 [Candidatus Paceibacterota bacterium]|nr:hypothetical protein [Candidatus Paceibacterota bacterium]
MEKFEFEAVTVYHDKVDPGSSTLVGAWIHRGISPEQRRVLMGFRPAKISGHVGVYTDAHYTWVLFLTRNGSARKIAVDLRIFLEQTIGVQSILQRLPNYRSVSRALAF